MEKQFYFCDVSFDSLAQKSFCCYAVAVRRNTPGYFVALRRKN
jgi:hypothetical protein